MVYQYAEVKLLNWINILKHIKPARFSDFAQVSRRRRRISLVVEVIPIRRSTAIGGLMRRRRPRRLAVTAQLAAIWLIPVVLRRQPTGLNRGKRVRRAIGRSAPISAVRAATSEREKGFNIA